MTIRQQPRTGPTAVYVNVILGALPFDVHRVGDWTEDQTDPTAGDPFVSIVLGENVTLISSEPDHLERLGYTITDAAAALRAIRTVQAASVAADQPHLFDQATA